MPALTSANGDVPSCLDAFHDYDLRLQFRQLFRSQSLAFLFPLTKSENPLVGIRRLRDAVTSFDLLVTRQRVIQVTISM